MRRFTKLLSMVSLGLGLNSCWLFMGPPEITPDVQTFSKQLTDADGDGFMASPECDPMAVAPFCFWVPGIGDPGCVISPNPNNCAAIQWEQTISLDADGWFTYDTSETCIDAEGKPVGETQTETGASVPPVDCWQIDETCWECYTSDGEVFSACVEPTQYCESDEDCTDGESCIVYPEAECPPNALCAPDFGVGVCGVVVPDIYCNTNEECPDGFACTPNDDPPCVDEACLFYEPFYSGICTPSQEEGCASDADCSEGEVCGVACENINGYCPIGDATVMGECFPVAPAGCGENTTANGCEENPSCDWIPDPGVACFTEPCDFGTCVEAQPTDPCASITDEATCSEGGCTWTQVDVACGGLDCPTGFCSQPVQDPCTSHGDPDSCNSDFNNFCGWVEDPTIVCVTEPCYQGSCHNLGCGDVANP